MTRGPSRPIHHTGPIAAAPDSARRQVKAAWPAFKRQHTEEIVPKRDLPLSRFDPGTPPDLLRVLQAGDPDDVGQGLPPECEEVTNRRP